MNNYYSQNAENCILWISELRNKIHYENILCAHTFIPYVQLYVDSNIIISQLFGRSSWNFVCTQSRCGLTLISLSLQLNRGLGFYDLNFLKNACNRSAANFKRSSWIVIYKEIIVQWRLGLNLWKIHRSVLILSNFEFFEESAVSLSSAKFRFSTK